MAEFKVSMLNIQDSTGNKVPNRMFRSVSASPGNTLGLVMPGLHYTADMPLLYYPTQLLLERGADVLQVTSDYTAPSFTSLSRPEQALRLVGEASAALAAGRAMGQYAKFVLIGKSIGTLALAGLAGDSANAGTAIIWVTPLLQYPLLVDAAAAFPGLALYLCGTADSTFNPEALERVRQNPHAQALVVEGANHSLEIPDDVLRSLRDMERIMQAVASFLDSYM